jgi:predicted MFS family arabinose efflux permease
MVKVETKETPAEWEERLFLGRSGRLSVVLALGSVGTELSRQLLPPLLPAIVADLSLSPSRVGGALTVMWLCFAAMQYPAGRSADQLSSRTMLSAGSAVMVLALTLLTLVDSYATFVLATATLGIGVGLFIVPMRVLLSDLFVDRRGQAFGLNTAAAMGGGGLAAGLSILALRYAGWRLAFLPVALLVVAVFVFVHRYGHEPYIVRGVDFNLRGTVERVFRDRQVLRLVASYSMVIFTWQAAFSFLPTFLQVNKEFSSSAASGGFALLFLVGLVVMPAAGGLSDRVRSRPLVGLGSTTLAATGLAAMVIAATTPVVVVGLVLFAAGLLSYPPVMQAHMMDLFPDSSMGGDFGAFRTVYFGVASLGPAYVGVVAEFADYAVAFAGLVACLLVSAGVLLYSS